MLYNRTRASNMVWLHSHQYNHAKTQQESRQIVFVRFLREEKKNPFSWVFSLNKQKRWKKLVLSILSDVKGCQNGSKCSVFHFIRLSQKSSNLGSWAFVKKSHQTSWKNLFSFQTFLIVILSDFIFSICKLWFVRKYHWIATSLIVIFWMVFLRGWEPLS